MEEKPLIIAFIFYLINDMKNAPINLSSCYSKYLIRLGNVKSAMNVFTCNLSKICLAYLFKRVGWQKWRGRMKWRCIILLFLLNVKMFFAWIIFYLKMHRWKLSSTNKSAHRSSMDSIRFVFGNPTTECIYYTESVRYCALLYRLHWMRKKTTTKN